MTCGAHTHTIPLHRIYYEFHLKILNQKWLRVNPTHFIPRIWHRIRFNIITATHSIASVQPRNQFHVEKVQPTWKKNSDNQLSHHQHRWSNENSSMQIRLLFRSQFYSLSRSQCVRFKFHFEPFLARIFIPFTLFTEINKNANTLQELILHVFLGLHFSPIAQFPLEWIHSP